MVPSEVPKPHLATHNRPSPLCPNSTGPGRGRVSSTSTVPVPIPTHHHSAPCREGTTTRSKSVSTTTAPPSWTWSSTRPTSSPPSNRYALPIPHAPQPPLSPLPSLPPPFPNPSFPFFLPSPPSLAPAPVHRGRRSPLPPPLPLCLAGTPVAPVATAVRVSTHQEHDTTWNDLGPRSNQCALTLVPDQSNGIERRCPSP